MPIQKPSPHRFIAPNAPSTQTPKPKPKSNLRHAITAHTPKQTSELQFKKITPAKRFVVAPPQRPHPSDLTPRAPDRVEEPDSSASPDYTPRPRQQRKLERVESIEEASQSSPSRPADDAPFDVVQTIEHDAQSAADEDASHHDASSADEILFETEARSKRRRTSPPTPTLHHARAPETPLHGPASHRFRFPPQTLTPSTTLNALAPTTPITTASAAIPARPHFLLPPSPKSPQIPSRPLPEIFSPSRKTQKYTPNGLASTVQGWIIDAAQTGFAASERSLVWGREREDGVVLRVKIASLGGEGGREVDCFAGGVLFVRGVMESSGMYNASRVEGMVGGEEGDWEVRRILLAGQGSARGAGGVKVRVGGVVGIRAPTWDIDVGGETWLVGVDWVVL